MELPPVGDISLYTWVIANGKHRLSLKDGSAHALREQVIVEEAKKRVSVFLSLLLVH